MATHFISMAALIDTTNLLPLSIILLSVEHDVVKVKRLCTSRVLIRYNTLCTDGQVQQLDWCLRLLKKLTQSLTF